MSGCFDNSPEDAFRERELNEYLDDWDRNSSEEELDENEESCEDEEEEDGWRD